MRVYVFFIKFVNVNSMSSNGLSFSQKVKKMTRNQGGNSGLDSHAILISLELEPIILKDRTLWLTTIEHCFPKQKIFVLKTGKLSRNTERKCSVW